MLFAVTTQIVGVLLDTDTLAKCIVCLYLGESVYHPADQVQTATRYCGPFANFSVNCRSQVWILAQGGLSGEHGVAIVIAQLLALCVKPACIDQPLPACSMDGTAEESHVVLMGSCSWPPHRAAGIGASAIRTLHVCKFHNRYASTRWRLQGRWIVYQGSRCWCTKWSLGKAPASCQQCCQRHGGRKASKFGSKGEAKIIGKVHACWTAPCLSL